MSRYRFTPQAAEDLLDIWSFISLDNIEAADRVEAAVFNACDPLLNRPALGKSGRI
jgi:plasmid stabilization system protein ParE